MEFQRIWTDSKRRDEIAALSLVPGLVSCHCLLFLGKRHQEQVTAVETGAGLNHSQSTTSPESSGKGDDG